MLWNPNHNSDLKVISDQSEDSYVILGKIDCVHY